MVWWGPLHLTHFIPWILHIPDVWPHFQQFLHCGTLGFILAPQIMAIKLPTLNLLLINVICKSTRPENYIPIAMSPLKHTSLPSTAAIFLTTYLMVVLQPSRYSVFHDGDTPIQLGLPWRCYSCQCLNTEISAQCNRSFTNETLSISYTISFYIRLVVTL